MRFLMPLNHYMICITLVLSITIAADAQTLANSPKVDADFSIQGEYTGSIRTKKGEKKLGAQIIALGDGKFQAVGHLGGLPGDGWDKSPRERVEATVKDGVVLFQGKYATGKLADGKITISRGGKVLGTLKRVVRKSPTLGKKAPKDAVILFDGSSVDAWVASRGKGPAKMTKDGLLTQGSNSKAKFQNFSLHLEFRTPYKPKARGQGRGNSGLYVQGRYETQILDSFGLEGRDNECGGIYSIQAPDQNMCFPPLSWQTYDVDFTTAIYDADGKKTKHARMTVRLNGVMIHDNVELPHATAAAPIRENAEPGFIHLQDHGNPVHYRNIFVVEKKEKK